MFYVYHRVLLKQHRPTAPHLPSNAVVVSSNSNKVNTNTILYVIHVICTDNYQQN